MRLALVVNPRATRVSPTRLALVTESLEAEHDVNITMTAERDHATAITGAVAGERTADALVVLGGDGTVNEVANGLIGTGLPLAVLPGGSTNVFARTIGMTNALEGALRVLLHALEHRTTKRISAGSANGRFFLFHAGAGFDAAVVAQVEKHPALKRWLGQPAFVWAAFATWFGHFDRATPGFTIDGARDGYLAIVLNSDPYTYLGTRALRIAPNEAPLTVVNLGSLGFFSTLGLTASALGFNKPVRERRDVEYGPDVDAVTLTGHRPIPLQVDGDYIGAFDRIDFQLHPEAVTIAAPRRTDAAAQA